MTFEATVSKLERGPESMIIVSLDGCDTFHTARGGFQFMIPSDSEVIKDLVINKPVRLVLSDGESDK